MKSVILIIVTATSILVSCNSQETPSNLNGGRFGTRICIGDREFGAQNKFGFDFNADKLHLGNIYWAAVASTGAYLTSTEVKPVAEHFGKSAGLKQFKFYGDDGKNDVAITQGFWAQFDKGQLVAYRGTQGTADLITDLSFWTFKGKAFNREGKLEQLKIHKGFWSALDTEWNSLLKDNILSAPIIEHEENSEEAFRSVNAVFRGLIQEADIHRYMPNEIFKPHIKNLQDMGIIKKDANVSTILMVLNIWAEEAQLATASYYAATQSGSFVDYKKVVSKGLARKKRNLSRVQKHFVFRQHTPIWLTGHSLGGALATITAYRLLKIGVPVKGLITFGSPKVGNDVFEYFLEKSFIEDGINSSVNRFQNDNDGVTRMPPFSSWRHIGSPMFITESQQLYIHAKHDDDERQINERLIPYESVADRINFYNSETPSPDVMKGIWQFDLFEFVSDHWMDLHYLEFVEKLVFGKKAEGC